MNFKIAGPLNIFAHKYIHMHTHGFFIEMPIISSFGYSPAKFCTIQLQKRERMGVATSYENQRA